MPPRESAPPAGAGWRKAVALAFAVAAIGMIALAAFAFWLFCRPQPKIIIPPEVQARKALENLRQQAEDGLVLSRVSQVVRHYFIAAFQLPPGEFTTTEFGRALSGREPIGAELATAAAAFLRDCDDRKFSPPSASAPPDAVNRALKLIELAEQRRAQRRQTPETQTQGRSA